MLNNHFNNSYTSFYKDYLNDTITNIEINFVKNYLNKDDLLLHHYEINLETDGLSMKELRMVNSSRNKDSIRNIGFVILGIFQSMFNTGYISILQEIIPINIFGRILSSISFFQSILTIVCIGALSEYFNIRYVVVASTIIIFIFSTVMFYTITANQKNETLNSN